MFYVEEVFIKHLLKPHNIEIGDLLLTLVYGRKTEREEKPHLVKQFLP